MPLGFVDPFDTLLRLQRTLDMPNLDDRFGRSTSGAGAFPPVNVFQKGDHFIVMAELPGLDKTSLTLEVRKNHIRLAGQRPTATADGKSYHRRERAGGDFDRTITLPVPLDSSGAKATYQDGILTVTLPQAEEAKPRMIAVT